jgi:sulfonate transport system substrate-binding protein
MLLAALNAGAVDLGQIGDAPLSFASAGGNRMRVIAAHRSDPGITALVVGRTSSIQTVADLRGRSVATLQRRQSEVMPGLAMQRGHRAAAEIRHRLNR